MIDFSGLPKSERQIVFYCEGESYWVHLEAILKQILEISDVPINYISSSSDDPGLQYQHANLKHFLTDNGWVRNWMFENIDSDIVVMTMPDLETYQIKRSKNPVHYVYVQHSLVSLHMVYGEQAFDYFDTIFCAGPHHVQEMKAIEAAHSLPQKNVVQHGYGRLDSIISEAKKRPPRQKLSNAPIQVLVAPSWGGSMIIESVGDELVETLLSQGFHVTLRPHPQTARRSKVKLDKIIKYPSPSLEPTHSPITAPITLTAIATLVPENRNGIADGTSTFVKICQRRAPSVRIRLTTSRSVDLRPSTMLTTIGKNAIRATTMTLGVSP